MYIHQPFPTIRRFVFAFARSHDDIPAFHAAFLVGTFLAATVLNLGFFAILIFAHIALDIVKYRDIHSASWLRTFRASFIESLFDVTLLSVALTSSLYLHHSFALTVLSGLSRAELTVFRALATILPKMQILEHSFHLFAHVKSYLQTPHPSVEKGLTQGQRISVLFLLGSVALLLVSPFLFASVGQEDLLRELVKDELVPWTF